MKSRQKKKILRKAKKGRPLRWRERLFYNRFVDAAICSIRKTFLLHQLATIAMQAPPPPRELLIEGAGGVISR